MSWSGESQRHSITRYAKTRRSSIHAIQNPSHNYEVPIYAPPSANKVIRDAEMFSLKDTLKFKYTELPVDKKSKIEVYKPKKGTVLPLSPEFIRQYIVSFIPEQDRKGIRRIVIANYIPGSECEKNMCLAEYIPPDTLVFYYQKLNSDGTYGSFKYTREEYIARLLFDVIPHEIGHKVDCSRYTKATKRACVPSERAERGARAYAKSFRDKWHIPDAWYYSTNTRPETFASSMEYALYKTQKHLKPPKSEIGKI